MAREPQQGDVDVTLFVPCYNEEENVAATLETIEAVFRQVRRRYEVIVIDDASKDSSVAKVHGFLSRHPAAPVRLVVNPTNRGLASNFHEAAQIGTGDSFASCAATTSSPWKHRLPSCKAWTRPTW